MDVESEEFQAEEMHRLPPLVPSMHHSHILPENLLGEMPPSAKAALSPCSA